MFEITDLDKFNNAQAATARNAINLLNLILYSGEFAERLRTIKFTQANGYQADGLLQIFRREQKVKFRMYSTNNVVVGYTNGDGWIYMNSKFFDDVPGIVGNTIHERAHQLGFKHPKLPRRWYWPGGYTRLETPYALGDLAERIAKEWMMPKGASHA